MSEKYLHSKLTEELIGIFYVVYNQLGYGFLEKVYQNAMYLELKNSNYFVEAQKEISVIYKDVEVGKYYADLIVNDSVIIELKASEILVHENELQLINYLKATDIEVGLLMNFGKKPEVRRKIFSNTQ
ncbi:MAG: GxxExxY protein [Bacteroidia bacterium]|jgi:GxxExxY protein